MSTVEVVIPIGPGDPGLSMPDSKLLHVGLSSIKNQAIKVILTCAVDSNLGKDKLDIIEQYADNIVGFDTDSYFRPGGIWNKIYTCWEKSEATYVAWNGYDDYSSPDRFLHQRDKLDATGASSCTCNNFKDIGKTIPKVNDGHGDYLGILGRHFMFMGCFLLRKDSIVSSGISEHRYKWVLYFEGLLYAFIIKMGLPVVSDGIFYYRFHPGTIAKTAQEDKEWVKEIRSRIGYSLDECRRDWDDTNIISIIKQVRSLYA